MLLIGPLKPGKRLLAIVESQVSVHERGSRNVAQVIAFLQFAEEPKCIRALPGVGIRPDEHTDDGGGTMRNRECLFEERNRFLGLTFGDKTESKILEGSCIVRLNG